MTLGIVISSNDPETAWNALRVGNHALALADLHRLIGDSDKLLTF
jgi:hypothetical protein